MRCMLGLVLLGLLALPAHAAVAWRCWTSGGI
jgi:hypothetical protein